MTYKGEMENVQDVLSVVMENPDNMVIDTGATKSCGGSIWYEQFLELADDHLKKRITEEKENRSFRFGNNLKFPSKKLVTIPIEMGKLKTEVKVSVVDAHIPLLLGLDGMEKLGISIDLEKRIATTSRTNESFKLLRTTNGHLALPFIKLQSNKTSVEKCLLAEEEVFVMDQCDMEEKLEKVRKIHNILCHPKPEILKNFFYDSSDN